MAADGNAFLAHAPQGRKACGAVDGVAACLQRLEGGADIILRGDMVAIFEAGKREYGRGCLAKFRAEQRRRDGDEVDAGFLRSLRLFQRHDPEHGELALSFHRQEIGNGRAAVSHLISLIERFQEKQAAVSRPQVSRFKEKKGTQAASSFLSLISGEASASGSGFAPAAISISPRRISRATALPGPMPLAAINRPSPSR